MVPKLYSLFTAFAALLLIYSCSSEQKADLILHNGRIYTVDADFSTADAMVIKDGKIKETGDSEYILTQYTAPQVVDLEERYVYPGFMDPHSHFMGYSTNLLRANLWMSASMDEITNRLREHQQSMIGEWLQGRGWDQNLFPTQQMPDNKALNEAFPDTPVYIVRVDGHAAVANQKALDLAGITPDTHVEGGEVVVEDDKPTGLLIDRAMYLVSSQIPAITDDVMAELLQRGQADLFEVGLTSVCDAGLDKNQVLMLDSLFEAGELDIRVYAMLNPTKENYDYFLPRGPIETSNLTVRSIKLFADGALGSRGALLKAPYEDEPDNLGLLVDNLELMVQACELALAHNYQVNTHCIGDSANHLMLDMYSRYLKPGNDLRWRIEHAQVVDPDDFYLFGKYGIVPSVQAIHAVSDMGWAENRLGAERIKGAYAYKDLLNQAGWLPNGSDFPVEQINPLYSFHAAFTRTNSQGEPKGGWYPEQSLSRRQALKGMTIWSAKANFEEHTRGSLESGKFADFVIMDEDLLHVDESIIYDLPVLETWVGGVKVYERE